MQQTTVLDDCLECRRQEEVFPCLSVCLSVCVHILFVGFVQVEFDKLCVCVCVYVCMSVCLSDKKKTV